MTDTPLYQQVEALEDLVERRQARIDELSVQRNTLREQLRVATNKLNEFVVRNNELERKLDKQEPYLPSTHELAARNQRQMTYIADLQGKNLKLSEQVAELMQAAVELKVSTNEDRACEAYPPADSPYLRETALRLSIDVAAKAGGASAPAILSQARSFETYLSTPTDHSTPTQKDNS